jgi:hypothetical protein
MFCTPVDAFWIRAHSPSTLFSGSRIRRAGEQCIPTKKYCICKPLTCISHGSLRKPESNKTWIGWGGLGRQGSSRNVDLRHRRRSRTITRRLKIYRNLMLHKYMPLPFTVAGYFCASKSFSSKVWLNSHLLAFMVQWPMNAWPCPSRLYSILYL